MDSDTDLIIKIVQLSFMLIVLSIFLYRRYRKGIRGYHWLMSTLAFGAIQSTIEIFVYKLTDLNEETDPLAFIHFIPYALILLSLFLHIQYFMGLSTIYLWISISAIVSYLTVYTVETIFGSILTNATHVNDWLFMIIFDTYQLYIFTFCMVGSAVLFIKSWKTKFVLPTSMFLLMFVVSVVVSITEILEHILVNFDIYGAIGFGVSIIVLFLIYIIWPSFVYATTASFYRLLIINKTGATMLDIQYPERKTDQTLAGGVITAFTSLIGDVAQAPNQNLLSIKFEGRTILTRTHEDIVGLLIVDKDLRLFRNSHKAFVEEFYTKSQEEIKNFTGDVSPFSGAAEILLKMFPYLVKDQISLC